MSNEATDIANEQALISRSLQRGSLAFLNIQVMPHITCVSRLITLEAEPSSR